LGISSSSEGWIRPFRGFQNILIFYIGIKLEVVCNNTSMVDFGIAVNRILIHPCTPLRGRKMSPVGGYGDGSKNKFKDFEKLLMKMFTIHIVHIKYTIPEKSQPLAEPWA